MKSIIYLISFYILATAVFGNGCSSTQQLNSKTELQQQIGKGPIRALTIDSLLYTFETFFFNDSILSGHGTLKHHGLTMPFEGSVPFNRIVFIEGLETSYWKAIWVVPIVAGVAVSLDVFMSMPQEFEIHRPTPGGSCPYIYAFNGKQFTLEAEAFGTSISKSLEAQTFSVLPSLVPINGSLIVRIGNNRPETHLLNSVQLLVGDAREASSVALDINNVLWPIQHPVPPVTACNNAGKDIMTDIVEKDSCYWKSNLSNTAPFSGFRDELYIQFDLPRGKSEATLIIHAINTELINEVYHFVGEVLGDATLEFYNALEQDLEFKNNICSWIRECSLKIELEYGTSWREIGLIYPEANTVSFSRAIRISGLDTLKSPLRFRLSSLTDVWRIDAVSIDFSSVKPIPLYPARMISVTASDNRDWRDAVKNNDLSYAIIIPPNYIDVTFDSAPAINMKKPVYVFAAQGYLYEWFRASTAPTSFFIPKQLTGNDRLTMLKILIQQKDLFLPPVYAAWKVNTENKIDRDQIMQK